jgi:hypothetical protein
VSLLWRLVFFRPFDTFHYRLLPLLLFLLAGIALPMKGPTRRLAYALDRVMRALSRKSLAADMIAGALGLAGGAAFFAIRGFPVPQVHDEFSYLLAADTFAHGRLTNPAHPFWQHFESFHIIQQPTYASMYPPGQGLVLAAGTYLFGNPWFGVCISVAILCSVTGWALRGWLPAKWAFAGSLMVASVVPFSYWMTSYWGGAVAAIGGALVLGAWPRLKRRPAVLESLLFALGVVILANTRMLEGAVLVAVAGPALFWSSMVHPAASSRVYALRVLLPAGIVLLTGASWTMFYFWRVTGNPLLVPYVLDLRTYSSHRLFPWQNDPPPPVYRHDVMRRLYSLRGSKRPGARVLGPRLAEVADFYGGSLLFLPLGAFWWLAKSRKIREILIATTAVTLTVAVAPWIFAHYLAPAMVGYIALILQGLRYLGTLRIGGRRPWWFAAQMLLVLWLAAQWKTGIAMLFVPQTPHWAAARANLQNRLAENLDPALVLVRYEKSHNPDQEWVYNGADLFNPPVLWARAMTPEQDLTLIRYCPSRTVWLLEPDNGERLSPYPVPAEPRSGSQSPSTN